MTLTEEEKRTLHLEFEYMLGKEHVNDSYAFNLIKAAAFLFINKEISTPRAELVRKALLDY